MYIMNNGSSYKTFSLFMQPYLDKNNQCYKNIITLNLLPEGPLARITKRIPLYPLSPYNYPNYCGKNVNCALTLLSLDYCANDCSELMLVDEIPNLFSYLMSNGYTINSKITNMLNANNTQFNTNNGKTLICFVTYEG